MYAQQSNAWTVQSLKTPQKIEFLARALFESMLIEFLECLWSDIILTLLCADKAVLSKDCFLFSIVKHGQAVVM